MARGGYPSDKQDQYMLRFPDGMRDRLKAEAAKNNRSMNAEIVARLNGSFEPIREGITLMAEMREMIDQRPVEALLGMEIETLEALDKARADFYSELELPIALRVIVRDWLSAHGYLNPSPKEGSE